jgi:hypothetical protein
MGAPVHAGHDGWVWGAIGYVYLASLTLTQLAGAEPRRMLVRRLRVFQQDLLGQQ